MTDVSVVCTDRGQHKRTRLAKITLPPEVPTEPAKWTDCPRCRRRPVRSSTQWGAILLQVEHVGLRQFDLSYLD